MEMSNKLLEAHFCSMSTQSNVYGLAKLHISDGMDRLLVASLKRKVYLFEYSLSINNTLTPLSREIQFTYIPSAAEIISIDAFNKSTQGNDFIVGITFVKNGDGEESGEHYLNIYSCCDQGSGLNIDLLAQTCHSLALDFTPYQLTHTEVFGEKGKETVFLLTGSDEKIHVFREEKVNNLFNDVKQPEIFPEFQDIPSIVTKLTIKHFDDDKKRLTVFGCENGFVAAFLVNNITGAVLMSKTIQHDSPITAIEIFSENNANEWPSFLQTIGGDSQEESSDGSVTDIFELHILVSSAIEPSVVYNNFLELGFKDQQVLKDSDKFDCVLAACVADINMDSFNEIILGTYGQELLVYKLNHDTKQYDLSWRKSLAYPVLALDYEDITNDGLKELMVLSVKGLHVLQHDLNEVADLCTKRLNILTACLRKNDAFKELQAEEI